MYWENFSFKAWQKMRCVICKEGEYNAGMVTMVLTRNESTIVIKKVPGLVCVLCGEYELYSDTLQAVLAIAFPIPGNRYYRSPID